MVARPSRNQLEKKTVQAAAWLNIQGGLTLDVAQRGDGMDDHLGESGRKGAPVRGLRAPDTRLDCAGSDENKKILDTFCLSLNCFGGCHALNKLILRFG